MTGKSLHLEIEISNVRNANEEELSNSVDGTEGN